MVEFVDQHNKVITVEHQSVTKPVPVITVQTQQTSSPTDSWTVEQSQLKPWRPAAGTSGGAWGRLEVQERWYRGAGGTGAGLSDRSGPREDPKDCQTTPQAQDCGCYGRLMMELLIMCIFVHF